MGGGLWSADDPFLVEIGSFQPLHMLRHRTPPPVDATEEVQLKMFCIKPEMFPACSFKTRKDEEQEEGFDCCCFGLFHRTSIKTFAFRIFVGLPPSTIYQTSGVKLLSSGPVLHAPSDVMSWRWTRLLSASFPRLDSRPPPPRMPDQMFPVFQCRDEELSCSFREMTDHKTRI